MATSDRQGRTWLCSVVFLDIAGYTQQSVTRQINVSGRLQQLIAQAVADIPESERIIVDTGDGAALCYLGDPEEALLAAIRLRDSLAAAYAVGEVAPKIRIGINLGPVKVVKTLTGQLNPLGDGINNAQRVMSFADPGQILISRSFYDVIACLSQEYAPLFSHGGVRKDKHAKEHEVYALTVSVRKDAVTARVTQALSEHTRADSLPLAPARDENDLKQVARELADFIGPLASVLVRKTASRAPDDATFYRLLAEALPEGPSRRRFLAGHGVAEGPVPEKSTAAPSSTGPWDEAELKQAEHRLAVFLGPVAKVLVRKTAKETTDRRQFYRRLADELGSEKDRETFLGGVASK